MILRYILVKPPSFYNIRNLINYKFTMESEPFMTFEQFKEQLGSWAKPLEHYTKGITFQNIYKFIKKEYESGKKVITFIHH